VAKLSSESRNYTIDELYRVNNDLLYRVKNDLLYNSMADALTQKTLNSSETGISSDRYCGEQDVIVSLTTYGKRLYEVYLSIESIMQGSMKPNRIILWLAEELQGQELPITLLRQQRRGLDIRYCNDIKSYKKLIPTLKAFPNACIITVDDDFIYKYDLVERLVSSYKKEPEYIHANIINRIVLGNNGKPTSYLKWERDCIAEDANILNFFIGFGGILYPPGSLSSEVLNESVFSDICQTADDVWLNAMALLNGTRIKKVLPRHYLGKDFLVNESVQDTALYLKNANHTTGECQNDPQITAVYSRYHLFEKLIEER
jgi:hypothetical protein